MNLCHSKRPQRRCWPACGPPAFLYGSDHGNPDFAALAAAYGLRGARASHPGQVDTLFNRALELGGPQLLELVISPKEQPPANWAAIFAMLGASPQR